MAHQHLPKAAELTEARFQKFAREFAVYEAEHLRQAAQDQFLDAYSIWMRHRSPVTYENLVHAILNLRQLDSAFQFPLPGTGALRGLLHA